MEQTWFPSYLNDRQQLRKVNGISSNLQYIECGVPQGSFLGPLLFLLFTNNMSLSFHDSKVTINADDNSLAYTSNSIDDMTKSMNAERENIRKWLHGNKLTLYVAKTTSTIIGTNRKVHQTNSRELIQAQFKIPREAIEQQTSEKYPGAMNMGKYYHVLATREYYLQVCYYLPLLYFPSNSIAYNLE